MEELKPATCPNCGSPLDVKPGDTEIKCAYCGSSIIVGEHPDSTPEVPQYTFKINDQTAQALGTAGKMAGGIAIGSFILPIIITVVVLCGVGATLFFIFRGVNSSLKTALVLPTSTEVPLPTPFLTDTPAPTATPLPTDTLFPTPVPFTKVLFQGQFLICFHGLGPGAKNGFHPGIEEQLLSCGCRQTRRRAVGLEWQGVYGYECGSGRDA
ncbi:MAG: hypothetical protein ABSA01_00325 [Anaerolineales bacterium]|jgi:LSD1 subclass zinc finger protein